MPEPAQPTQRGVEDASEPPPQAISGAGVLGSVLALASRCISRFERSSADDTATLRAHS